MPLCYQMKYIYHQKLIIVYLAIIKFVCKDILINYFKYPIKKM